MSSRLLIPLWKAQINSGTAQHLSISGFMEKLSNDFVTDFEKQFIVEAFVDDWQAITATWFEMFKHVSKIESLANNLSFVGHSSAARLASKVHYCKGSYEKALDYVLASGEEFELVPLENDYECHDETYMHMIIRQALNTYISQRRGKADSMPALENLVDRIFCKEIERGNQFLVIGMALDTQRIDVIKNVIQNCKKTEVSAFLADLLQKLWTIQLDIRFKEEVLLFICKELEGSNYLSLCQCLIKLDRPKQMAEILNTLVKQDQKQKLLAYQIVFDLHENAPQEFLQLLKSSLEEGNDILQRILSGEETIRLHMQFLIKNNHTDMHILREMKDSSRGACTSNATIIANGLMHIGTTCDDFLRDNLEWVSKATNWNKFNAVASLGCIHKGHERDAKRLLDPYLPKGDQDQFGYKEGGSLYAYGLIHANHGNDAVIQYLLDQLNKASSSAVRHGACLGLGLAALGTRNQNVYDHLKEALYQNEAVTGEAAGTSMGLLMAGSMNESAFDEMHQYLLDTDHDKIKRGLCTGIAMLAYGAMEKAEDWIRKLESSQSDVMLRQTAVCMMAMAYVGTGNPTVIQRLLEKVASDPSGDVKRFAVIAVGFVLSSEPQDCLDYIDMQKDHFDGHVRYGAALAVGISCAGRGYKEAIALLEPLVQAKENYVRQGALIALSFVLIQQTTSNCPNVAEFRKTLIKMIKDKSEDTITKFGAIVAHGILDAGGRNVTLSLHNRSGQPNMSAVLGVFVFIQNWYWHAFSHFISLSFQPTCLIGLNKDLRMPKIEFRCNAKKSLFDYPPPLEEKRKEEHEKVETAVLSITKKQKGQTGKKAETGDGQRAESEEQQEKKAEESPEEKQEVPEPSFHNLVNPARVVHLQLRAIAMSPDSGRYTPVKNVNRGGIVMLQDSIPDREENFVELAVAGGTMGGEEAKQEEAVKPHEPFEFAYASY